MEMMLFIVLALFVRSWLDALLWSPRHSRDSATAPRQAPRTPVAAHRRPLRSAGLLSTGQARPTACQPATRRSRQRLSAG